MKEGLKMWLSIMAIFLGYAIVFILFEDYDRKVLQAFNEPSDWNLLWFSIVILIGLGVLLYRYAKRMDERISRKQVELENEMRRQLTQNISHELKTPVSSILGYMDTILDNPNIPEDTKHHFIVRSKEQAQRLAALLQDISLLNRLDYGSNMITMERVNVSLTVSDLVQECTMALEQKQMVLKNYLPEDIIIHGNTSLIYSIFRNLIDNSINYAGTGTTIEIRAEQKAKEWRFTFSDNGVGIPSEHLSRIFERFYRVDKGRSRAMGGTGLGLAIVKNAVILHGGTISVSIPKSGGVCFQFSLSKNTKQ